MTDIAASPSPGAVTIPREHGGWSLVWCTRAARAVVPTPFVRLQLWRAKGLEHLRVAADTAQAAAVATGALAGPVPAAGPIDILALAASRTVASPLAPPAAQVVGVHQVVLGLAVVLATGLGTAAPQPAEMRGEA